MRWLIWPLLGALIGCGGARAASPAGDASVAAPPAVFDARIVQSDEAPAYLAVERRDLSEAELAVFQRVEATRPGAPLPLDSPLIPARLQGEQRFMLLTDSGPKPLGPSRAVVMYRAPAEDHLLHVFDVPPGLDPSSRMVAVAMREGLPAEARTRAGERVDPDSPLGQRIVALTRAQLAALSADVAARGEDEAEVAPLEPAAHMQIVRGRFGRGRALLVAYAVPRGASGYLSGMFLADEAGEAVTPVLSELTQGASRALYLVDLEGDGVDEARFDMRYYEGSYQHLLYMWGGAPQILDLAGDSL